MSSAKSLLKLAKRALEQNDPEAALGHAKSVISIDPSSYYAFVFRGKAYQLLNDLPKAITSFKRATEIEPNNILAWKGYFQIVKSQDDYKLFFEILTSLSSLLIDQGISIADVLKDLRSYLDKQNAKNNDKIYEYYLRSILPGTKLGDLIGTSIENPDFTYKKLLDFKQTKVEKEVAGKVSRERVKFGRILTAEQKNKLDSVAWSYYEDGDIINLYENFLNVCDDDGLRRKYEEKFLKFKYELLKISPNKEELIQNIRQQVDDMILLKTTSLFCWNLYFDWNDDRTVNDLDETRIIEYLQLFQNEGLGLILFAFAMSDISPYNKEKIVKGLSANDEQKSTKSKETINEPKELVDEEDHSQYYLPQDEVLGVMLQGYAKAKGSVLANRIIVNYYIHLREYQVASERCREGIKILADIQRTVGLDLKNTKEDFLCSLAIVYTYYEAPKNYNRAIQLYDKILESNPNNVKAQVGKGLIYVERGELLEAKAILSTIVKDHPDNLEAESEYYWCLIKLGEYKEGQKGLQEFIKKITGGDLHSREIKAVAKWRIAKSYYDEGDINECYKYLIDSLKDSDLHAPSYTLLGIIFQEHYNDIGRAQKCFYKAFDLDQNEIIAAKYLVEQATAKNEWEVAKVLAKRVVTNETSRRLIMRGDIEDPSWAYRVLGCGALNIQDDAKAVEWFQNALRINSSDYECWVGLGEAYFNCGRFDAAAKVFQHALTMKEEQSWIVLYMLGVVTCEMKEFNEGLTYLYAALESKPNEECIISAIYETNIENANKFMQTGFYGRAINAISKALNFINQAISLNEKSQKVWKALGDSLKIFLKIQYYMDKVPYDELFAIFDKINYENLEYELPDSISLVNAKEYLEKGKKAESLNLLIILSFAAALKNLPQKSNKALKATAFYNLGLSLLEGYQNLDIVEYRELSIQYLKRAIKIENNNANYWIALGNAYFTTNPQISQHCYIKATTLEVKDAEIWINLASLYLKYGDTQLSQDTFLRAQSVAPQDAQSWLGNALATEIIGDEEKASNQYIHAFTLSKGKLALAQFLYGLSVANRSSGRDNRDVETAQEFSISNQAMQQYLKYYPEDEVALSVGLTIAERCKDFDTALLIGEKLCSLYEKKYEETESELILEKFALTKSQLARLYLGLGQYDKSIEEATTALELDPESDKIELSTRITLGLCYFFQNKFENSIDELKIILSKNSESSIIITLISQILYAHNTPETKQASIDQLFSHIEQNGSSLLVVLTLGAISLVDNLPEYFEPIKDELLALNLNEITADTSRQIPKLINEINKRLGDDDSQIWNRYAFLFPFSFNVWKNINNEMSTQLLGLNDNKITGNEYSNAMFKTGKLRNIQRSLLLNPDLNNWSKVYG
ncbi:SKI3 [Candida pseudojiufengensis]|uniref:SKI3 n=1 Tax=Candida pseudojiufengensis TaxID=497109 RepID=UPI00222599B8|nr:SKI3 [Candida pseudojiufengensis]KAI5963735.1 SKI3 [Candida pseudojiufengensis]